MRLFIAISLPSKTKKEIKPLVSKLKTQNLPLKWEPSFKWHLTLKFLGNVDKNKLIIIENQIKKSIKNSSSFYLQPKKLGFFSKRNFILWLSFSGQIKKINYLHCSLETNLFPLGFPKDNRPLFPHLTLARSKKISSSQKQIIQKILSQTNLPSFSPFKVNNLSLYQSILYPQGSQYKLLKNFSIPPAQVTIHFRH